MNFLQKPIGFLTIFLITLISVVLHNFISWKIGKEEPVFFAITFLALGMEIILILSFFIRLIKGGKQK